MLSIYNDAFLLSVILYVKTKTAFRRFSRTRHDFPGHRQIASTSSTPRRFTVYKEKQKS